jgi:hypothetical protein
MPLCDGLAPEDDETWEWAVADPDVELAWLVAALCIFLRLFWRLDGLDDMIEGRDCCNEQQQMTFLPNSTTLAYVTV